MKLSRSGKRFMRTLSKERPLPLGSVFLITLLASLLMASVASAQKPTPRQTMAPQSRVPETPKPSALPALAQPRISAAIGRDQRAYRAHQEPNGIQMTNPSNRLSATFGRTGTTFIAGPNHWTMTLKGYGYGRKLRLASAVAPHANANRVEYQRGDVSEWYVNGPFGLEQGFTLAHPPVKRNDSPLTLMLALSGDLSASVEPDKHALSLLRNGTPVLRYSSLAAQDATGHVLNAWMEVDGNSLRLRIDDSHAQYPVTVDPVVQSALLTASDGAAVELFGGSVAISANGKVIAVGAPDAITGSSVTGAVYVFAEPTTGGWTTTSTFAAKLTGSDATGCDGVGDSVSISGDGSLIVTGDTCETIGSNLGQGAAYVFVEPSGGWASSTETAKLTASDGAASDVFGASVSTTSDGSLIVVSAPNVRPPRSTGPGVAYIFAKPSGGWISATQTAELIPSSSQAAIGNISVSSDGSTIASGGNNLETVVVFVEPANGWVSSSAYTAILTASDAAANAFFGSSVSLTNDGGVIVVGAPFFGAPADDFAQGTGAAYVYLKDPVIGWQTTSNFNAELKPSDPAKGAEFGGSVEISGDGSSIIVGAPGATAGTKVFGGAFYIFAETANGWVSGTETAKLNNPDTASDNDEFAASVALSAFISPIIVRPPFLTAVVGARGTTINSNYEQGAAYIFTGYALSPIPTLSLGNASFSSPAGTTSASQSVTLTNQGSGPLNVSAEVVSTPFTSTQNCLTASPLAPGASCTEEVSFVAGTVGTFSGTLTFTDDAGEVDGSTQQVSLSGKSVQAGTSTSISGAAPDPAFVGQPVTVSYSVVPPAGDTLMPTGNVTVQASTGESCIGTVAAGSCSIKFLRAVPTTVTANYGGDTNFTSSFSSSVSEQVVDFSLTASPTSQTVPPGHLANFTLTLSSLNGFTGTVYASCGPQPPHSSCTVTPASLNLSNSPAIAQVTIDLENKGTYALTFAATNGFLIHMAPVTLGVK